MHNYLQHALLLLKRYLYLLIFYFLSRLFFYLLNVEYFHIRFTDLVRCFIHGIRFDIAAIVFTNIVFLLFVFPGDYKNRRFVIKLSDILFIVINAIALMTNFIDARFFDFINKRSSSAIFDLMKSDDDIWLLIPRFISDYWYVALSWLVALIAFIKWMPRISEESLIKERNTLKNYLLQSVSWVLIAGLMVLGGRGTKLKPISLADAASRTDLKFIPLVLNTPFSVMKTIDNKNLQEIQYFPDNMASAYYSAVHHAKREAPFRKMNVVIFILESFSKEYCGYLGGEPGYTPNLDSILRQSLVFPNAFANGTQSYEAMAAIIAGIPSLMDRPYGGSNYADNLIESLPRLLDDKGYSSSFFHGGNNGTMGFENFAAIAGIDRYFGRDQYNDDKDYDGHWGIWDEQFLQYFKNQIDTFREPFITTVFTLSSHHPYSLPEKYYGKFKEGELPVLKTIAYTDFALGRFFEEARKTRWFSNTLFVFTADHAAQAINGIYNSTAGMFSIPLAFYCPSDISLRGKNYTVCQQIDIMPSVLDYLNFDNDYFAFGESVFNADAKHRSISFVNGIYQLIQDGYLMQFDGKKVTNFYSLHHQEPVEKTYPSSIYPTGTEKKIYDSMETELKAIIETYNYCLIHNKTSVQQNLQTTMQIPFEIRSKQLP